MENERKINERLVELEARLAHQETTIQDLSDGIAKQWKVVDELLNSVRLFKHKMMTLEEEVQTNQIENPPPHY